MELMLLTVPPTKSPKNAIIAKLWVSFVLLPGLYFFIQSVSLHILDVWLEERRRYGRGAVRWEAGSGTKARLWQQAAPGKSSNSKSSWWQHDAAASCCGTRSSGCQMQPAGEPISCSWQRATSQPWECLHCQMSTAWHLPDLLLLWDNAVSYLRDQSCTRYCLYLFIYSFIHLCIFCSRLQCNQSWGINFSSEEIKWEPSSVSLYPLSE